MKKILPILLLALTGCSSTQIVKNWKNPDVVLFHASQVLVVGMAQDPGIKSDFETKLQKEFEKRGILAMRGIDLFDIRFKDAAKSEEELANVEVQLLEKGFDAILFTKVIGSENRDTFKKRTSNLNNFYGTFREDYINHQTVFNEADYNDRSLVYYTETSLYCICPGKEMETIWRGSIQISYPMDIAKTVDDYVKLVVKAMEEQDLIFEKEEK